MRNIAPLGLKSARLILPLVVGLVVFKPAAAQGAVALSLDPSSGNIEKDSTKDLKLQLDGGTQDITTVDAYFTYDSTQLQISTSDIKKSGTSYSGCEFKLKGVQVTGGNVRFMVWCEDEQGENQAFQGSNHIATITVKALSNSGSTNVAAKFETAGQTAGDCNASYQGRDYLTSAQGGTYNLTEGTSAETDTYLDCINSQCVLREGSQSDHTSCSGKSAGSSCTASSTSTSTSTTTSTPKGSTSSAVPQTAGSPLGTIAAALGSVGLIVLAVLVL